MTAGRPALYPFDELRPGLQFVVSVKPDERLYPSQYKPVEAWKSWRRQRKRRKTKPVTDYDVKYKWIADDKVCFYVDVV